MDQDKIKINEVGKQFFEIQFNAKENIIDRLNDEINNFKNKTEKFKDKTNRLCIKLKDNYEYLKKILAEKKNLEKILKAETDQLKQEIGSMVETGISRLKEKNDEFLREAGINKSNTAIYAGRLNKLDEFSKHVKPLEQKYINIKEQNVITDKNYEITLKKIDENKLLSEKFMKKIMLKRCVDLLLHSEKQKFMDECPIEGACIRDILDLKDMLNISNEQYAIQEKRRLDLMEENKLSKELLKAKQKTIAEYNTNDDDYSKKKNQIKWLGSELVNVKKGIQQRDKDKCAVLPADRTHEIDVDGTDAESQAMDLDVQAARSELSDIRSTNQLLDRRILKAEEVLLDVYERASVHSKQIKSNTNDSEEIMFGFIQNLCKELERFIMEEDTLPIL